MIKYIPKYPGSYRRWKVRAVPFSIKCSCFLCQILSIDDQAYYGKQCYPNGYCGGIIGMNLEVYSLLFYHHIHLGEECSMAIGINPDRGS